MGCCLDFPSSVSLFCGIDENLNNILIILYRIYTRTLKKKPLELTREIISFISIYLIIIYLPNRFNEK